MPTAQHDAANSKGRGRIRINLHARIVEAVGDEGTTTGVERVSLPALNSAHGKRTVVSGRAVLRMYAVWKLLHRSTGSGLGRR